MEFVYGTYDSEGQLINSVPLFTHGTVNGATCQLMKFNKDEYLQQIEIAVDKSPPSINRLIMTKKSTTDANLSVKVTVGALRKSKDKSKKTNVTELPDAAFKTYGIKSWSVDGLITGFKWISLDATSYNNAKTLASTRKQEYDTAFQS